MGLSFLNYFTIFAMPIVGIFAIPAEPWMVLAVFAFAVWVHGALDWLLVQFGPPWGFWFESKVKFPGLYKVPLYFCFPVQLLLLLKTLGEGSGTWVHALSSGALCGISGGIIGIAAGHELIHSSLKSERRFGKALLFLINYPHFWIEHYIHHAKVATFADADTARRGESLYRFLMRSIPSGWFACWRWKSGRPMLRLTLAQLTLMGLILAIAGPLALVAFSVQGIVTLLLLKWINYVEHYGLIQSSASGKAGLKGPHSWDSLNPMTNWCLFNLGFHTQHHQQAHISYSKLPTFDRDWNVLPLGYANMMTIALFPMLWKRIMHPLLDRMVREESNARST